MSFVSARRLLTERELPRCVVVEAAWGERRRASPPIPCIPGSVFVDTDAIEDARPTWRLRHAAELQVVFGRLGLGAEDRIVVTGQSAIAAARTAFALQYAGATDVAMLDCGLDAWIADGLPTAPQHSVRAPREFGGNARPDIRASVAEVEEVVAGRRVTIVDVRSLAEFRGETSGYSYLEAKGRIPGSIHGGDANDRAGVYVRSDGRLVEPERVAEMWRSAHPALAIEGGRFAKDVVFVCGGGWRASLAFLFARGLGARNARVFSEGWAGWSTDYVSDDGANGSTPGFRQVPSGRDLQSGD